MLVKQDKWIIVVFMPKLSSAPFPPLFYPFPTSLPPPSHLSSALILSQLCPGPALGRNIIQICAKECKNICLNCNSFYPSTYMLLSLYLLSIFICLHLHIPNSLSIIYTFFYKKINNMKDINCFSKTHYTYIILFLLLPFLITLNKSFQRAKRSEVRDDQNITWNTS